MLVRSGSRVLFSASVAILLLSGCDWMHKKDSATPRPRLAPRIQVAAVDRRECGSQVTYERLKDLVFDAAVRVREGKRGSLDQLATYSTVRMEDPLVKRRNNDFNVTVCSGRFVLDLPPGAEKGFDGERQLAVDVEYASQVAADGSGPVYRMQGAEPLVYKLAIFDLQAQVRQAAGGPVVTFAAADPPSVPQEVPIPPPHNTVIRSPAELAEEASKAASKPLTIAAQNVPPAAAKPRQVVPAAKPQPTRLADRTVAARAKAAQARQAASTRLAANAAGAPHAKPKASPVAAPKSAPTRLADRSAPAKAKRSAASPKADARTRLASTAMAKAKAKPTAKPSAAPVRTASAKARPASAKPAVRFASVSKRAAPAKPAVKLAAAPARGKPDKPAVKLAAAPTRGKPDKPAVKLAAVTPRAAPAKPAAVPQPAAKPPIQLAAVAPRPAQPQPKPVPKSATVNPSFDCRGAQTSGERLVCANTRLASLDRAMFSLYRAAFGDGNNSTRDRLRRTRERFVAWRDRCASENCLASAYQGRMDEIRDIMTDR